MKISDLISLLKEVQEAEGNIEVTMTGSCLPDGPPVATSDVFETTVEDCKIDVVPHPTIGKRVRLLM